MGTHWLELTIVLLIAVLLFGAKRLPEMGSAVGKTIKEFQKSMREDTTQVTPPATTAQAQVTPPASQPSLTAPATPGTTAQPAATSASDAVVD